LLLLLIAGLLLLLAACATPNAPKTLYVQWDKPPCTEGGIELRRVQFVDTWTPVVACVRASAAPDAARLVLLTLVGMPVMACAVTEYGSYAGERTEFTTVYAPISPSLTQVVSTTLTFASPETVLTHEIEHAFGMKGNHSGECREQVVTKGG
jgi:hypothetical protein